MIIRPTGYFTSATGTKQWSYPYNMYDGYYDTYMHLTSTKQSYFFTIPLSANVAKDAIYKLYNNSTTKSYYTLEISLCYGDYNQQISTGQIGNTVTRKFNEIWTEWEIPFNFSDAEKNLITQHSSELLFKIYLTGSFTGFLSELEVIVSDFSKIYIGDKQASALYLGNQKASAVYLGNTKIL